MKKKLILTTLILIIVVITVRISIVNTIAKQVEEDPQAILYQDVIITTLGPTINNAIDDYYKNIFTEQPYYDAATIKILDIERPNGDRTWYFNIKIEVEPFFGPHIEVGKDIITIELSSSGIPVIKNFEHVEDFPLPDHYKNLYLH